jgi:hypothetical protein
MLLLLITCFSRGLVSPNLLHLTVGLRSHDAGLASALFGLLQLTGGALSSAAVAILLPIYGKMAVPAIMAVMAGGAAILWLRLSRSCRAVTTRRPAPDLHTIPCGATTGLQPRGDKPHVAVH